MIQNIKTIQVLAIKMERFHIVLVSIGSKENCCFLKHLPTLVCTYVINEWSLVTLWHKSFEHTVFACKQYLVMKLRPSIDSTLGWNSFWGRFLVDCFLRRQIWFIHVAILCFRLIITKSYTHKFAEFWTTNFVKTTEIWFHIYH